MTNRLKISKTAVKRPVRVCTKCKERKVKCDRSHPCSSCIRRGAPSECHYTVDSHIGDDQVHIFESKRYTGEQTSLVQPTSQPNFSHELRIEYMGANIYDDPNEILNIFDVNPENDITGQIPIRSKSSKDIHNNAYFRGPLSWSFVLQKDPSLSLLTEFMESFQAAPTSLSSTITDSYGNTTGVARAKDIENENLKKQIVLDLYVTPVPSKSLIDRILEVLPDKYLIKFIINEFFNRLGSFISYVDEVDFRSSLMRLFVGYDDYSLKRIQSIELLNRDDLAYVGICLIVLRLGYLSLISYSSKQLKKIIEIPEVQYLLSNPIDLKFIELAEECFKKFNLVSIPSFIGLQFALMMRIYQKFSPEFGEGLHGGDSQLFTGVIIQMAYSLGLNRDPDYISPDFSEREKVIRRKLWYSLMFSDMLEVCYFGNPFNTNSHFYDTKPVFDFGSKDTEFNMLGEIWIQELKGLLLVLLNNSNNVKISSVVDKLNRLESFMKSVFGEFPNLFDNKATLNGRTPQHRSVGIKIWISVYVLLITVYVHLYLHFQKKRNFKTMFFYVRRLCITSAVEVLPSCYELVLNSDDIFGDSSSGLIFIPTILQVLHRSVLVAMSYLVKCKFIEYGWRINMITGKLDPRLFTEMNNLTSLMKQVCQMFLKVVKRLSSKYYYAWDIQVSIERNMNGIFNDQFYAKYYPVDKIGVQELTLSLSEIQEICAILRISVERFNKVEEKNSTIDLDDGPTDNSLVNEAEIDNIFSKIFGNESEIESWSDFATAGGSSMDYFHL